MSDEPSSPANLDLDLSSLFLPAWAKEGDSTERLSRMAERDQGRDRMERPERRRDDRGPRQERRSPSGGGGGSAGGSGGKRPSGGGNRSGSDKRPERREERRPEREERPAPGLTGWEIMLVSENRGMEALAKQIKATAKAYPLFDLARLVLEKPERFLVEFNRTNETATPLFQVGDKGGVWAGQNEAVTHLLTKHFAEYYRTERVTVEPPKGIYPFIAQCGLSGILLGPPNFHDYQSKIRKIHAERYGNMAFEAYKGRIRMVQDEASIQKWKEEQSVRDEHYPLETVEGAEPLKLISFAEVERHFKEHHAPKLLQPVKDTFRIPGVAAALESTPPVQALVRYAMEELKRFPLPLAHTLSRSMAGKGLQLFKAHENITYVSMARPRYLDREATPVSDALTAMLEYLEGHRTTPRAEQWAALVVLRPLNAESGENAEVEREAAVAADLNWLLREGHVIDFAKRSLEAAKRPQARPLKETREAKPPKAPRSAAQAAAAPPVVTEAALVPPVTAPVEILTSETSAAEIPENQEPVVPVLESVHESGIESKPEIGPETLVEPDPISPVLDPAVPLPDPKNV